MKNGKVSQATLQEVARRAGFVFTISRYLKGSLELLPSPTRDRVQAAIAELKYPPMPLPVACRPGASSD